MVDVNKFTTERQLESSPVYRSKSILIVPVKLF